MVYLALKRYLPSEDQLEGSVLYLETSEEMPSEGFVYRFLATLGEMGILQRFKALLFARPKAQFCGLYPPEGRESFFANQKSAVKKALRDYNCELLTVFDLDFGHTNPQVIIPNGGVAVIDGVGKTLYIRSA